MPKVNTLSVLDPLKVFLEYDTQYETYVAQCLQTGHLVTADDPEMAKEMIKELLTDEVSYAMERGDLSALLSNPAHIEKWLKFELIARSNEKGLDKTKITMHGEMPQSLRLLIGSAEVETEIQIATGRTAKAA